MLRRQIILMIMAILFSFAFQVLAADNLQEGWRGSVITDPSISIKCEILIDKRQKKINNKQKLVALLDRNHKLRKITPQRKVTIAQKLKENRNSLNRELLLTREKIRNLTETIIRKGCPGITLSQ